MARLIYVLCAVTSLVCTWLLLRGYVRTRARLLLWSGLCFAFLSLSNILLYIDLEVVSSIDLSVLRAIPIVIALALLLYGLIWETR
jgi:energy-converting hydrogenase Eha subunit G